VFHGKAPAIRIDHLDATPSLDLAQAVGEQLRTAGFAVSLQAYSSDDYKKLLAAGKEDFAELGWFSNVPSPDPFLAQQLRTGSANNPLAFTDKTFDGDIDRARATQDETARVAAYAAAQDRALALMPLVPLVFFRNRIAVSPAVHGFRLDGAGIFDASAVWLSR
jgi:ABC-type transport system substrate-binding protein